jgi:hypothetical protein
VAVVVNKLRDAGLACEVVYLEPVKAAVLKRDRIIVILALALLTASAWAYVLGLSVDMNMSGMDMTGLRMIPSGMGAMMQTDMPWQPMEFAFVFAMWLVMMIGMMTPSAAPMFLIYTRMVDKPRSNRRLVQLFGSPPAISSCGSRFRCSPPWRNGPSSVVLCSILEWPARATCSAGSYS